MHTENLKIKFCLIKTFLTQIFASELLQLKQISEFYMTLLFVENWFPTRVPWERERSFGQAGLTPIVRIPWSFTLIKPVWGAAKYHQFALNQKSWETLF